MRSLNVNEYILIMYKIEFRVGYKRWQERSTAAAMKVVQQAGQRIENAADDADEEVKVLVLRRNNECELPTEVWASDVA